MVSEYMDEDSDDFKKQRIKNITTLYYTKPEVQKAIFDFSHGREVAPSFMMEGFGKRPDSLQYPGDIMEMVKKGATSFHCSEELWKNPLEINTGMTEQQLNELREGWDLILDIDSKYLDYSKILVKQIIRVLNFHGVKNIGIKFSGSKGFHIIVPWKAFPKEINGIKTSDMFPNWARIILKYISDKTKSFLIDEITQLTTKSKYVKDFDSVKEVIPDIILVSTRHLFRMPYSLHEKTCLASVVLELEEIEDFQPREADPLKVKVRNFLPNSEEGEATELLREALDWNKEENPNQEKSEKQFEGFKPVQIKNLSNSYLRKLRPKKSN